jgi:hypothetical protein
VTATPSLIVLGPVHCAVVGQLKCLHDQQLLHLQRLLVLQLLGALVGVQLLEPVGLLKV